jgi:membrane fusion protein (multidrug efflux system)
VRNAAARVRDAYLTYSRTALPAPVSGFVAKRAVQLGQRVAPGAPLMAIVPLDQVWVDANFKEPQLAGMRVGQPVKLTADLYGGKVVYHGKVAGFGAGTGSAFALLPAQNATGNWIKIVQRVPVRIALDAQELASHPLQIGLSMQVEVDTHERSGERLPLVQSAPTYATDVFHSQDQLANERVRAIIAANEPGAARLARSESSGPGAVSNGLAGTGSVKPAVAVRGNMM